MIVALSLGALALWGIIATVVVVAHDGYRPIPDDPDHDSRVPTRGTRIGTGGQARAGDGRRL